MTDNDDDDNDATAAAAAAADDDAPDADDVDDSIHLFIQWVASLMDISWFI